MPVFFIIPLTLSLPIEASTSRATNTEQALLTIPVLPICCLSSEHFFVFVHLIPWHASHADIKHGRKEVEPCGI